MKKNIHIFPWEFIENNQMQGNQAVYDTVLARKTSLEEAIVFKRFLWFWKIHKNEGKGWIFLVDKKFVEPVALTIYAFRKVIEKWENLGLVRTKRKGVHGKKWYHIDEEKMAVYFSQAYACSVLRNRRGTSAKSQRTYNNKKNNRRGGLRRTRPCEKKRPAGLVDLPSAAPEKASKSYINACLLKNTLAKHRLIMREPKLSVWAKELEGLHHNEFGIVKWKEIYQTIVWLDEHLHDQYCPKPHSAKQFVEKYPAIRGQMEKPKQNAKDENADDPNAELEGEATLNADSRCPKGTKCSLCHRTNRKVYEVDHPTAVPFCTVKTCRTCYRKLETKE